MPGSRTFDVPRHEHGYLFPLPTSSNLISGKTKRDKRNRHPRGKQSKLQAVKSKSARSSCAGHNAHKKRDTHAVHIVQQRS